MKATCDREKTAVRRAGLPGSVIVLAVILSLGLHALIYEKSSSWRVRGISAESYDTIVPRTFRMKRVEIDPATVEETPPKTDTRPRESSQIDLPKEIPEATATTAPGQAGESLLKAPGQGPAEEAAERVESVDRQPAKVALENLLQEDSHAPKVNAGPLMDLPEPKGKPAGGNAPAFSSLDALLEGKEPLTPATAPILMPTDLLFEYDASILRPEAAQALQKLGTLITRDGATRFRIEGHTDSFGSNEYNTSLSLRRAEEVKGWLVKTMGIDASRISTAGFGKTRLLVPGTGSITDQRLNRRVEIVVMPGETPR